MLLKNISKKLGRPVGLNYCFPSHLDEIKILSSAVSALPRAPAAHYLLGNLLYDKKQYKQAVSHWEQAINENPSLTMAYRNLSIAYYNKQKDADKALVMIKKACELEPEYPRFGWNWISWLQAEHF